MYDCHAKKNLFLKNKLYNVNIRQVRMRQKHINNEKNKGKKPNITYTHTTLPI